MLSQGSGTDTAYSDWQSIWFTASVKMEAEVAHNEPPEELSKTWLSRLHPRPIRTLCRRTPDGQRKPAQPWLERKSSTENYWASQGALVVKNPPANAGDTRDVGWEDPLEEGMATHSSILAWRIPWTEKPGRLQSMRSQRVRHDWNDLAHTQGMGGKLVKVGGVTFLVLINWLLQTNRSLQSSLFLINDLGEKLFIREDDDTEDTWAIKSSFLKILTLAN